jgi:hypothetical protein
MRMPLYLLLPVLVPPREITVSATVPVLVAAGGTGMYWYGARYVPVKRMLNV